LTLAKRHNPAISVRGDDSNPPAITGMPQPYPYGSAAAPAYDAQMLADVQQTFARVGQGRRHNGIAVIDLEDYFGFFNVAEDRKETGFGKSVEAKFHAHDINGEGMLTLDEVKLRCDSSGCM
jgi:hypothetical protein